MWQKLKIQLEKIQNSDEAVKKRWLIGATAVAAILVIGLWLIYLNSAGSPSIDTSENQGPATSFWSILKNGLTIIADSIKESVKTFILKITGEKTITIK